MMRCLPGSLDPGAPPLFTSPADVIAWVRGVDWLLAADRAVLLHVDQETRLTCVATTRSPLKHLGPTEKDALVADALDCCAAAVIAVDVRPKLPLKAPSTIDHRCHRNMRQNLAVHGVFLLDTVIVTPTGGISVTGEDGYCAAAEPSWLQVHAPPRRSAPGAVWAHEGASSLPPGTAPIDDRRGTLWLLRPPD